MAKIIVGEWDGPVCFEDRYWASVDDAIEELTGDCWRCADSRIAAYYEADAAPEYLECCDEHAAITTGSAESVIEYIAEKTENRLGEDYEKATFGNALPSGEQERLEAYIQSWAIATGWTCWKGNGKQLAVRPLIQERIKTNG